MIDIVGGLYKEYCDSGRWSELYGSGLRAAAALSSRSSDIRLTGCVGKSDVATANAVARTFGVQLAASEIDETISFAYLHGLASPEIFPRSVHTSVPLTLVGDNVLAFGMIESEWQIVGKRVVYDPQDPVHPIGFRQRKNCQATSLAIVCNSNELRLLTKIEDITESARALLSIESAEVVVVKCGARGALVCTSNHIELVPAFLTSSVWPLGSGDVFAAIFAHQWACLGEEAVESAVEASKATAFYCQERTLPIPLNVEDTLGKPLSPIVLRDGVKRKRIYLAGPFFNVMERWMIEETRSLLTQFGFDVFSPLHDVGIGSASKVVQQDLRGLQTCDGVFAVLDNLDSGTLFEVGYARAIDLPVVGYAENVAGESLKMLEGTSCHIYHDFVSAIYGLQWVMGE
ncbi:PfkB family carbohydrate kinase [Roseiconus lacunae]|uniref:PfkB family carbohydrate kinase n=1 Tax=Roseiconus lacunae TaxID=2605694 RepID=UPI001E5FBF9D|nr:PfkB family carbohydrate kinase [Roseiconus lacunae]MCD0462311.1 PfkB family carbohydrate kinase [Roseiconus lacunae]